MILPSAHQPHYYLPLFFLLSASSRVRSHPSSPTPPSPSPIFLSLSSSLGAAPQDPSVLLLDPSRAKKTSDSCCMRLVCVCVTVCVCVCACLHAAFLIPVSPHMLALTCWWGRIMSYKPLIKTGFVYPPALHAATTVVTCPPPFPLS